MSDRLDLGDKNDEYRCGCILLSANCGQQFNSRQELKEHESARIASTKMGEKNLPVSRVHMK